MWTFPENTGRSTNADLMPVLFMPRLRLRVSAMSHSTTILEYWPRVVEGGTRGWCLQIGNYICESWSTKSTQVFKTNKLFQFCY